MALDYDSCMRALGPADKMRMAVSSAEPGLRTEYIWKCGCTATEMKGAVTLTRCLKHRIRN